METIKLEAKPREIVGRKVSELRDQNLIPAIVYGKKIEPTNITVDEKTFDQVFKKAGDTTVVDLKINDKSHKVLIQNVDYTPTQTKIVHIEFLAISLTEKVKVNVPVVLINTEGPKKLGGNLIHNLDEIEIEALPNNIPHQIEIDCSVFKEFGHTFYIKDLNLGDKVKILKDMNVPIVSFDEQENIKEEIEETTITPEEEKSSNDEKTKKEENPTDKKTDNDNK
jgi:large subunit ribosomal protein L25